MKIIWDPAKAESNFRKHKIRFSDAEVVLFDPMALTIEDKSAEGEQRFISVGSDALNRVVVIVYTYRGTDVQLISARRATRKERKVYEKEYDFKKAKRGSVFHQKGKTRITIYIDNDILEDFRARADKAGHGYQTMINEALKEYLAKKERPVNEAILRKVIREEFQRVGHE